MKENYELKIKSIYQNIENSKKLETASSQLEEGIRVLRKC